MGKNDNQVARRSLSKRCSSQSEMLIWVARHKVESGVLDVPKPVMGQYIATMVITKALRQEVRSLKRKQDRWQKRRVIVEGTKCIEELLTSAWKPERIYFTPAWKASNSTSSLMQTLDPANSFEVSSKDMEMMSAMKQPPGVLLEASLPLAWEEHEEPQGTWLYLDGLKDPGNVGTLMRVADWFGLDGVALSPDCADPLNPKTIQGSMGSVFHVPWMRQPLTALPASMKHCVWTLDAGGTPLPTLPAQDKPSLLVVGSESHGISADARELSHQVVAIPGAGRAESLNASVAGAIAVAHLCQQG